VGGGSPSSEGRICNNQGWFTLECARKRRELKRMEGICGGMISTEVLRLRKEYRLLVKKCKAEYEERQLLKMYISAFRDPKQFYSKYKKQPRTSPLFTLQDFEVHFQGLLQGDASTQYVEGNIMSHCQIHEDLFGAPTEEHCQAASILNDPVSHDEVVVALRSMQPGKSSGPDGIPNEFFSSAFWEEFFVNNEGRMVPKRHYVLAEALACLFSKVLESGMYPDCWAVAALVPVPKPKSNGVELDDFRGIAVGNALGKIYAKVIMNRMDLWAERQGHRAFSQFGFRGKVGTLEAAFVLRHMVEACIASQHPLYAAFIDFRKAYDRVDRKLLWRMLEKLGVHGHCLHTLKAMYAKVLLQVRLDGKMGEPFLSSVGVKQGDPLSPLLFGLFIDRFQWFLQSRLSLRGYPDSMGIKIGDNFLKMLLYADDMVLAATESPILQVQLDILEEFCTIVGMEVNTAKSECVIFNKGADRQGVGNPLRVWHYGQHELPTRDEFVYLGVRMGDEGALKADRLAAHRMINKGRGALMNMMGACQNNGLYNPFLQRHLYQTLVSPVMSYGCELWGPLYIASTWARGACKGEQEDILKLFMRMCLWVPKCTPIAPTMMELNCTPMLIHFLKRVLTFWNRLVQGSVTSLHVAAFQDNIMLHDTRHKSWVQGIAMMLIAFGYTEDEVHDMIHSSQTLPVKAIVDKAVHICANHVAHSHGFEVDNNGRAINDYWSVREIPDNVRDGFKHMKYDRWFRKNPMLETELKYRNSCCLNALFSSSHVRVVSNFRLGMGSLNCETLRSSHPARSTRHCVKCDLHDIEDEVHVLVCPAYRAVRDQFPKVFQTTEYVKLVACFDSGCRGLELDKCMSDLMNVQSNPFWQCFAQYLVIVKSLRQTP